MRTALLELTGLRYVGSGVLGSALAMDKTAMKTMLGALGFPQVRYYELTRHHWLYNRAHALEALEHALSYPMFVKPSNLGSSLGISKAVNRQTLHTAIAQAYQFDRRVIVEQGVDSREFEVEVLGWDHAEVSVVGEMGVNGHPFYNYRAKDEDATTELSVPADIPEQVAHQMQELAIKAVHSLDCAGLARVDSFWERATQRVLLNAINTLPGFTPYSTHPVLWEATGVSSSPLIARLTDIAIKRHQQRPRPNG